VTQFEYDTGENGTVSDDPPCDDPAIHRPDFASCVQPPLYDTGGKHKAVLRVDFDDGSALCDALTVNVRTAPLVFDVDVTTKPSVSAAFVPGDPKRGTPVLTVRAKNNTAPDVVGGGIVLSGNVLTCETEAKVGGTLLTRTTYVDLQHCSATLTQPCDNDADCRSSRCPTCQPLETCLTADHCSVHRGLGCANDRDCEPPRCPGCNPDETCVKVLPASRLTIGPGDAIDLIDSPIPLINVLTTPAKIKETWTAHSFNAGDATATQHYTIKPRPDVKPARR
jgi:hypothetical protein